MTEAATWKAVYTESAREYVIVWVVEGVETTNKVAYGQNPAWTGTEPSKEGYTFLGWNSDPTATTALATPLPAVTGDAFYYAVFEENQAVEPDPVDSAQVAIDSNGFKVTFVSKQAGIFYQLVAADSCDLTDAQWKGEAASGNAEPVAGATATSAADTSEQNPQTITLTAPMSASDTKKFYKIKASIPSGN